MLGIAKLKECLVAVDKLVVSAGVVFEDGKVGFGDLTEVPALFSAISNLGMALPQAMEEVKDLDLEEGKQLIAQVLELLSKIAAMVKMKV